MKFSKFADIFAQARARCLQLTSEPMKRWPRRHPRRPTRGRPDFRSHWLVFLLVCCFLGLLVFVTVLHMIGTDTRKARLVHAASPVETVPVRRQTLEEVIGGSGTVEQFNTVLLTTQTSARDFEVPVKIGDIVKKGDLLVRWDDRLIQATLEANRQFVATSCFTGAAKGIRHMHDAFIAPDHDYDALGRGIVTLLKNRALAAQLGANARATVLANFQWRHICVDIEGIYQRLVETAKRQNRSAPSPRAPAKALTGEFPDNSGLDRNLGSSRPAQRVQNPAGRPSSTKRLAIGNNFRVSIAEIFPRL
jgi:multidrug efflux pump subunit AcrA (membrane-fusion protein)